MDRMFSLSSAMGDFDLTPDQDCRMVYVNCHQDNEAPRVAPREIPSWFFEPETIWFYFGASESEDKVEAGARIKNSVQEVIG